VANQVESFFEDSLPPVRSFGKTTISSEHSSPVAKRKRLLTPDYAPDSASTYSSPKKARIDEDISYSHTSATDEQVDQHTMAHNSPSPSSQLTTQEDQTPKTPGKHIPPHPHKTQSEPRYALLPATVPHTWPIAIEPPSRLAKIALCNQQTIIYWNIQS
jgi:hypothetical protein